MSNTSEQVLYKASPAMFRNNVTGVILCVLLFWLVLPLFLLIILYVRCLTTKLIITNHKTVLRKGILSKHTTELLHEHIRSVGVSQRFMDRIFNVGRIDISTASSGSAEISVSGMVDPEKIKRLIQQYQRR